MSVRCFNPQGLDDSCVAAAFKIAHCLLELNAIDELGLHQSWVISGIVSSTSVATSLGWSTLSPYSSQEKQCLALLELHLATSTPLIACVGARPLTYLHSAGASPVSGPLGRLPAFNVVRGLLADSDWMSMAPPHHAIVVTGLSGDGLIEYLDPWHEAGVQPMWMSQEELIHMTHMLHFPPQP